MTTALPLSRPKHNWTIAALCSGTALSALNSAMIAVALATLRHEFQLDVAGVTWVITTYYLASAALQPLMGRLADQYGPRRLFVFGMGVIIVVGILTPFAPSFLLVCVARVLLAVGTATALPSAVAMLRGIAATTGRSAPKMIGRIQMIDTGAMAVGPVVGGLLITSLGWEAIFWINIPLAGIALISTLMLAPADGDRPKSSLRATLVRSDIPGVVAFTVTIAATLMFILGLPDHVRWWLIPVTLVAAAAFTWRELHCATPFVDLRLLAANIPLLRVYAGMFLVTMVFYSALFGLPQFLDDHGGYRTDAVGALILPLAASTLVFTPFVERLIERRGLRYALIVGSVGLVIATVVMAAVAASSAPFIVLIAAAAMGIPYCILVISLTRALYAAARPEEVGEATGLFQTSRCLGGISSTVVVGVSFATGTVAVNWLFVAAAITVLAAIYLILLLSWRRKDAARIA